MYHAINENTAAFANTYQCQDSFFIFHDGLPARWEADAQVHLASRGFANRQTRKTVANKGTRYEGKIAGDFP